MWDSLFVFTTAALYSPFLFEPKVLDDGLELATAAKIWGVAHPPGYPLYTLCAALFSRLLFFCEPYRAVGVMTLLFGLAGGVVFRRVVERRVGSGLSLLSALLLLSAPQSAGVAIRPEVYTLHLLFFVSLVWVVSSGLTANRKLAACSAIQAAALAHSPISVLFALVWVYPVAKKLRDEKSAEPHRWKAAAKHAVVGFLPLLFFAYLPIAASFRPAINWGDASTWEGFWWLVTGGDYAERYLLVPFFGSFGQPDYLAGLANGLRANAASLAKSLPLLASGAVLMVTVAEKDRDDSGGKTRRALAIGLCAHAAALGLYCVHYRISDIADYHPPLLASLFLALSFCGGALRARGVRISTRAASYALSLLLLLQVITLHISKPHISQAAPLRDLKATMSELPPRAVVVTQGDEIYGCWYYTLARPIRPDTICVGANFVNHWWYESFFSRRDPGFRSFRGWPASRSDWAARVRKGIVEPALAADRRVFLVLDRSMVRSAPSRSPDPPALPPDTLPLPALARELRSFLYAANLPLVVYEVISTSPRP